MPPARSRSRRTSSAKKPNWPGDPLQAISMFKSEADAVHASLGRITQRLEEASIPYAVMGGMAVFVHGHQRLTDDVDVLMTREGLETFRRLFVPNPYQPVPNMGRRFVDTTNQVTLDVLLTGLYPGRGKPGPIVFPDPSEVRERIGQVYFINLLTLIQLKLAARRHQDLADVVSLIQVHNLDESFLPRLHASTHADFSGCLEEKRREDEFLARNG